MKILSGGKSNTVITDCRVIEMDTIKERKYKIGKINWGYNYTQKILVYVLKKIKRTTVLYLSC
jgi:hypothetical protein